MEVNSLTSCIALGITSCTLSRASALKRMTFLQELAKPIEHSGFFLVECDRPMRFHTHESKLGMGFAYRHSMRFLIAFQENTVRDDDPLRF